MLPPAPPSSRPISRLFGCGRNVHVGITTASDPRYPIVNTLSDEGSVLTHESAEIRRKRGEKFDRALIDETRP